jgi:hypothetical protein
MAHDNQAGNWLLTTVGMPANVAKLDAYLEVTVPDSTAAAFDDDNDSISAKPGDTITLHARNTPATPSFTPLTGSIWVILRQTAGGACPAVAWMTNATGYCAAAGMLSSDGGIRFVLPQFSGATGRFSVAGISERNADGSAKNNIPPWSEVRVVEADSLSTSTTIGSTEAVTAPRPLNDTGITGFGNFAQNGLATEPATHPGQDARYGRDAQAGAGKLTKIGGGGKGFDFSKIANNGSVLPESAVLGSGASDWACTRDNVTGLIWEVKTTDGLRSQSHSYTWYNSNAATNGGAVGTASGGSCFAAGRCDTEKFTADVNAAGLCGASDWRMPKVTELEGIADYGHANPAIDPTYFPNTSSSVFWSGSSNASSSGSAWNFYFYDGNAYIDNRYYSYGVRLVRGGE